MADQASGAAPSRERVLAAVRETCDDAAPFALAAGVILVLLALLSLHAHWDLLGRKMWWIWLIGAAPYILLWATFLFGLGTILRSERRRELVIAILALVWAATFAGVVVLVSSLVAHSGSHISGRQLLVSGAAV